MNEKLKRFFTKNGFKESDIKYIVRENKKTNIHLMDGRVVETHIPLKSIAAEIDSGRFQSINKGITVNTACIYQMEEGVCLMDDGREFKIRARMNISQKQYLNRNMGGDPQVRSREQVLNALDTTQDMPVAFCLLEYKEEDGLLVRYCNRKMETFLGLLPHAWYGLYADSAQFPMPGAWLYIEKDIAQNGGIHSETIQMHGEDCGVFLFQPYPDYCVLIVREKGDRRL